MGVDAAAAVRGPLVHRVGTCGVVPTALRQREQQQRESEQRLPSDNYDSGRPGRAAARLRSCNQVVCGAAAQVAHAVADGTRVNSICEHWVLRRISSRWVCRHCGETVQRQS